MTDVLPTTSTSRMQDARDREEPGTTDRLSADRVSQFFLERIPRDYAREYLLVSQGEVTNDSGHPEEIVVTNGLTSAAILHNVGARLGMRLRVQHIEDANERIAHVIDEAYEAFARQNGHQAIDGHTSGSDSNAAPSDTVEHLLERADLELLSTGGKGPIIQLVDRLLFEALGDRASDMHVQPTAQATLVRYRIDGVLHDRCELTARMLKPVISRIKVMGRMDIAESRVPQDGRSTVTIAGRPIDLRISTIPTSYGERAVIRLLDHSQQLCDFNQLGMPEDTATAFADRASRGNGIILVTGPTGSGKTTTLYSTLRRISSRESNIMTIEDPIEYELSSLGTAISQAQVNTRKGITFATGLRHILRQDPDVIMVGEIRDLETARIAIQSSLTGHLVFSTLHTNDAPSAITRLIDLGVEAYLVGASLSAALAQRLVRRVHQTCGGDGCDECLHQGFYGRCGLFELLLIDEHMRELITQHALLAQIRAAAKQNGMRSLRDDGARLIHQGITTLAEVARVVELDASDSRKIDP